MVERLLGVDSRVIPAAVARAGTEHRNVGIFYRIRITGGWLRAEPNGAIAESRWTPIVRRRLPAPVVPHQNAGRAGVALEE
ncbi:hypothetical protein [Nonomuraea sp. MG754425]|uniref:hypothetical protein n=1 Tax=Nonomuraea sp. MG754425 TaxID=2570319 RepID=UPI001F299448|nr:hypothetical protein [Nonomuraea sp. MG754425]